MPELKDYSGPFNPDLKFEDFSKDFLLKLMRAWQHAWIMQEDAWYEAILEKHGPEDANDIGLKAWVTMAERVHPRYAKLGNIRLNTVVDSLKALQLPLYNKMTEVSFSPN